ncbi:hypothetical protein Tco_1480309 [Tanacetum coccineum]
MEQMLLAKKDEVGVIRSNEQNKFLIADAAQLKEIEELSANICMMAIIQPSNIDSDEELSYDSTFISEVQTPSTSYINPLFSNINSGSAEHDKNAHDSHDNSVEQLARNAYKETDKKQILAQKVKQQNVELTKQLEQYKERVRVFETNNATKTNFHKEFIEADRRAKRLETGLQNQYILDRDKIRALKKERDDLQLNVSEQRKQVLELQTA